MTIDGRKYSVVKDYSGITIPDGYQEIDYDYNGQKINAVKGIKTGLILMYLESEDGKAGSTSMMRLRKHFRHTILLQNLR